MKKTPSSDITAEDLHYLFVYIGCFLYIAMVYQIVVIKKITIPNKFYEGVLCLIANMMLTYVHISMKIFWTQIKCPNNLYKVNLN